jgi:hypothetical protein
MNVQRVYAKRKATCHWLASRAKYKMQDIDNIIFAG